MAVIPALATIGSLLQDRCIYHRHLYEHGLKPVEFRDNANSWHIMIYLTSHLMMFPSQDFEGQKLAEILQYVILGLFGFSGFIWGYICQSFEQTFYVVVAGSIIASLVSC